MTKIFLFAMILAMVSSMAVAQTENPATTNAPAVTTQTQVPPCPSPLAVRKAAVRKSTTAPVRQSMLSSVDWSDPRVATLYGLVMLLVVAIAFLLGRLTAPREYHPPQVVPPVMYFYPPAPPDPPRVVRP